MPPRFQDREPLFRALLTSALLASTGCALVPGGTRVPVERRISSPHHAYFDAKQPDTSNSRLLGVKKANPKWWIENSDSPLPWWWRPEEPLEVRRRTWLMRNPFHNFTNYVVGVADRPTRRFGINAESIWNEDGPVNLAVTQSGPLLYLPFVSYRGIFLEGYAGWRERGNLGFSLRRAQHDSDGTGPRGNSPLSRAIERRERLERERLERERLQQPLAAPTVASPTPTAVSAPVEFRGPATPVPAAPSF